jgi:hypothetical protein
LHRGFGADGEHVFHARRARALDDGHAIDIKLRVVQMAVRVD